MKSKEERRREARREGMRRKREEKRNKYKRYDYTNQNPNIAATNYVAPVYKWTEDE